MSVVSVRQLLLSALTVLTFQAGICRRILDLSYSQWTVYSEERDFSFPGSVPGGIYSDLRSAEFLTEDIFYRFNDQTYRWVAYKNWTYSTDFKLPNSTDTSFAILVFEGLDTVSEIWLNNQLLGTTDNMFTVYRFPVSTLLQVSGNNHLEVRFESPVKAANNSAMLLPHKVPTECWPNSYHGECHVNLLRKLQASFAWDWGPAFPSVGIWKSVTLETTTGPVLAGASASVLSQHSSWIVDVTVWLESIAGTADSVSGLLAVRMFGENKSIFHASGKREAQPTSTVAELASASISFTIPKDKVQRWWPNGMGVQPLYPLEVMWVTDSGVQVSTISIGFRTLKLVQEPVNPDDLSKGLTFYFLVNGVQVFAKGSNWIPMDILPEKSADKDRVNWLLESAAIAHFNMLRVWGGGLYESDHFYRKCDELGIMVWQDLMFACNMYPADQSFFKSVRKEIYQQVARLQHHPSIVLWAGNNENEVALRQNWYKTRKNFSMYQDEYIKLYIDTIRPVIKEMDPSRPFVISSPSNGPISEKQNFIADNPQCSLYGDVHYYNYLGNLWSPEVFPKPRFASEYGVQSLPSLSTLEEVTKTEDLELGSSWWNSRQHQPLGWTYLGLQLGFNFPPFNSTRKAIYFSQINQAVSIQVETEHYRRMKNTLFDTGEGRTMGALYWQLLDIWQAPSWSSIEYSGKWKMLHYYAKKFMAPVILSSYVTADDLLSVWAVSDSLHNISEVSLHIFLQSISHFIPLDMVAKSEITLEANKAVQLYIDDLNSMLKICPQSDLCFFQITLSSSMKRKVAADSFIFPTKLKDMPLVAANVTLRKWQRISSYSVEVIIQTDAPAFYVWLDCGNIEGAFDDNGFHMTSEWVKHIVFNFRHPANYSAQVEFLRKLSITHAAAEFQ